MSGSARTAFHLTLLGVAASMAHRSSTPPSPPPSEHEFRKGVSPREHLFGSIMGPLVFSMKSMTWISAGCTAAVLVARDFPNEYSNTILQRLTQAGLASASRIQLTPVVFAGCALTMAGSYIRFACFRKLDHFFTFEVAVKDDHRLCTDGPYSVVRHPSYTGWYLQSAGILMWSFGAGSWIKECGILETPTGMVAAALHAVAQLYPCIHMFFRCAQEDALMRKQFGEEWDAWARRVPYRLVPYIY